MRRVTKLLATVTTALIAIAVFIPIAAALDERPATKNNITPLFEEVDKMLKNCFQFTSWLGYGTQKFPNRECMVPNIIVDEITGDKAILDGS